MGRSFNALGLEKDTICFGEGGKEFTLGDIDGERAADLDAAVQAIDGFTATTESKPEDFHALVVDLVAAACEDPDGVRAELKVWMEHEDRTKRIGSLQLGGAADFVIEWMTGASSGEASRPT